MILHDAPSDYLHCFNASKCGYDCVTELVILCQELLGSSMTVYDQQRTVDFDSRLANRNHLSD